MNIDYEIVESAKTEFSELKNKRYHLDYVGKTKDKIYIHIEFQARFPTKKELQRIFAYVALLHNTPAVLLKPTSFVFKQYRTTRSSISTVKTMFLKLTSCP